MMPTHMPAAASVTRDGDDDDHSKRPARSQPFSAASRNTKRICSARAAAANMTSGINWAVNQGRPVVSVKSATIPSASHGRPPSPCVRKVSTISQTIIADWTTTLSQNAEGTPR